MLDHGADVAAAAHNGETALMLAADGGHEAVANLSPMEQASLRFTVVTMQPGAYIFWMPCLQKFAVAISCLTLDGVADSPLDMRLSMLSLSPEGLIRGRMQQIYLVPKIVKKSLLEVRCRRTVMNTLPSKGSMQHLRAPARARRRRRCATLPLQHPPSFGALRVQTATASEDQDDPLHHRGFREGDGVRQDGC